MDRDHHPAVLWGEILVGGGKVHMSDKFLGELHLKTCSGYLESYLILGDFHSGSKVKNVWQGVTTINERAK